VSPLRTIDAGLSGWDVAALKAVVAISGAVLMSLEILGSRVLAPSYGSSVYVWGSIITTFLIALALGYSLGGRIADRRPSLSLLSAILALGAVLILPSVLWAPRLLEALGTTGWDTRWAALAAALALFLPPSLAMGAVTPFGVRVGLRQLERAGTVSGGFSALSTAGSIAGTLVMTFFLIPRFPVRQLLMGLAATLACCALLVVRDRASLFIAAAAGISWTATSVALTPPASVAGQVTLLRRDTPYHHILVTQVDTTRWMRFDNLTQSAVNVAYPDRIVGNGYVNSILVAFALRPSIRDACVIGLGGGILPRAMARIRPDVTVDSVEIDPAVREIALKYFLYAESDRLRTAVEDGRVFLSRPGKSYDLIVLDAFNSTGVPFHLATREFYSAVRGRLKPGGVVAANFVGELMGPGGKLFWATYRAIRGQFGQVYAIGLAPDGRVPRSNVVVLATLSEDPVDAAALRKNAADLDARWKLPGIVGAAGSLVHSPEPPAEIPELTDAYAPVEALQNF
jgi:spermidine synthase